MQSHELLRQVFDKTSPKQISSEIGLSLSLIYKWAEPAAEDGSGATNPLDRVAQLVRVTNDERIVQWLAEHADGFFMKNPKKRWPHPFYVVPATNHIVQDFADLLSVIATAASDSHITAKEAKSIRARWEELKSITEGFVHCCEEGNFRPIEEASEKEMKREP
jgi:transposase